MISPTEHSRCLTGSERAAFHRQVRDAIEAGKPAKELPALLDICQQHVYRVLVAAGVRKFLLTPDERAIIEARRSRRKTP